MSAPPTIVPTERGLYCPAGDFHVDPWRSVPRAITTHAHSDHARPGSGHYLAAAPGAALLRERLGPAATIETVGWGEPRTIGEARVSLHPAGHVLGSAQVRIETTAGVTVISGDYKLQPDPTCAPYECVPCDEFVTECTFALPVFRWPDPADVARDLNAWWAANVAAGRTSLVLAYALGKAQRVLAMLDASIGPILLHGAVDRLTPHYRAAGVALPPAEHATPERAAATRGRALVIAPPSALRSPWSRRFGDTATAFASGWMALRGPRRHRAVDRGFVVSDHVDWDDLNRAVDGTGATRIGVTHGAVEPFARWLREQGRDVRVLPTRWEGEPDGDAADSVGADG